MGKTLKWLARKVGHGILILAKAGMRYNQRAFGRVHWSVSFTLNGFALVGAILGAVYLHQADAERKRLAFVASEMRCLELNIYHEARGEPELGRKMVAYVTVARAKENRSYWGGSTVCGVVYAKRKVYSNEKAKYIYVYEFEWTGKPAEELVVKDKKAWADAGRIAEEVYEGRFVPPGGLSLSRYYLNEKVATKQNCRTVDWFYTKLVPIEVPPSVIGHHQHFREAMTSREKEIAKTETDLCPPRPKPLSSR